MAGSAVPFEVHFADSARAAAGDLELELPDGVALASPLVRIPGQGRAFVADHGAALKVAVRLQQAEIEPQCRALGPELHRQQVGCPVYRAQLADKLRACRVLQIAGPTHVLRPAAPAAAAPCLPVTRKRSRHPTTRSG